MIFKDWIKTSKYKNVDPLEVTNIMCTLKNLTSLEGIEEYKNLKKFSCNRNFLKSIKELKGLTSLERLSLTQNYISSLEGIEDLTNLKLLSVSNNLLDNLNGVENLTNLQTLYCADNKLTGLTEISNLKKLEGLSCDGNNISPRESTKIPFMQLKGLEWDNNIPLFKDMHLLSEIQEYLQKKSDNTFRKINENKKVSQSRVSKVVKTFNENWRVNGSDITFKEFVERDYSSHSDISKIEQLNCIGQGLTDLNGIEEFTSLKQLDIANNKITDLTPLQNLTNLENLDCKENELTSLKGIENLTKLNRLCCSYNDLTNLDELVNTNIQDLSCEFNSIVDLKGIENLDLLYLYIHGNEISPREHMRIPFGNIRGLHWDDNIPALKGMKPREIRKYLNDIKNNAYKAFNENNIYNMKKIYNFEQFSINEKSSLSKFGLDKNTISNVHKGERLSHDAEVEEIPFEDISKYSTNDLFGVKKDGSLKRIHFGQKVEFEEGDRYFRIIKNSHERSVRYTRQRNRNKFDTNELINHISKNWNKYNKIFNIDLGIDDEKDEKYEKLMTMVSEFFHNDSYRKREVENMIDDNIDDEITIDQIILECFYRFDEEFDGEVTNLSLDEASHKFLVFIKDNIEDVLHDINDGMTFN